MAVLRLTTPGSLHTRQHGCRHYIGLFPVLRRVTGGFARGEVTIEGLDDSSGRHLTIDFQNENLIARCGETALCTVPDLICILERDTGTPINTELLRYGFRVVVAAFPAPAQLTSAQALQVVGPQAFGYDMAYRPLAPSPSLGEGTCAAAHVSLQSPPQEYMICSDPERRE